MPPCDIIVMGVSGSGKSTVGANLAETLGCAFLEGDAFHAPDSVAKMRSGQPLGDDDRWPWLDRLGAAIGQAAMEDGIAIAACSALKRAHRERLIRAAGVPLYFALLEAEPGELEQRMMRRPDHYMPASLLASQLAALERPGADESATTLDARRSPDDLSAAAWAWAREAIAAHPSGGA